MKTASSTEKYCLFWHSSLSAVLTADGVRVWFWQGAGGELSWYSADSWGVPWKSVCTPGVSKKNKNQRQLLYWDLVLNNKWGLCEATGWKWKFMFVHEITGLTQILQICERDKTDRNKSCFLFSNRWHTIEVHGPKFLWQCNWCHCNKATDKMNK